MMYDTIRKDQTINAFLIFTGSFVFAVCLMIAIHEIGHALSMLYFGIEDITIRINPFMGNTSSNAVLTTNQINILSLAGPVFNILIAIIIFFATWKIKNKNLILLQFVSFLAFFFEGVVALVTFLTNSQFTDWGILVYFGLHPMVVLVVAIFCILASEIIIIHIWNELNLAENKSIKTIFFVSSFSFIYFAIGLIIAFVILDSNQADIKNFLINLSIINILVFTIQIIIYRYLNSDIINKLRHEVTYLTRKNVFISVISGLSLFLFSTLFFN